MVGGLQSYAVTITQYALIVAVDVDDRYYYIVAVEVEVAKVICLTESFTAIFKVAYVMAMPYYAQWVGLAKLDF